MKNRAFNKLGLFLCLALLWSVVSFADSSEKITMTLGTLKVIDLPFVMESYRPSTKGIIRVENFSEKQLRLIAEKQGICELEVMGGGLRKLYSVSVVDNISEIMKQLQKDLDSLPELDISINQNYIVIRGEVSNIGNWEHFQKVLANPRFSGSCQNYATFRPAPEIMLNLKNLLVQAGFTVVNSPLPKETGEISMVYSSNVLTITGNVYNASDIETINGILATQPWLSTSGEKEIEGRVRSIVKLKVIPTTLWIDIVFVALNKNNMDSIGTNSVPSISTAFSNFYNTVLGRSTNQVGLIGGDMQATTRFLASNGITRMHDAGCVVLKSNDPEGSTMHIGGKTYVKVGGTENGSLQQVDSGLKLTVKGGLISRNEVDLQFDLSNSSDITAGANDSFAQEEATVKNSVVCSLNNTIVLGGYKKIVQDTTKSGLPFLRNTPVLKWFVAQDSDSNQDDNLIILACPRLKNEGTPSIDISIIDQVTEETDKVKQDNKQIIKEDRKKKKGLKFLW